MSSPMSSAVSGQVNPTLSVEAEFRAKVDDGNLTTLFDLDEVPEIGSWLMSFVDLYLAKQGKLTAHNGIAPPPGGAIQDELVRGGIIFLEESADGGVALSLNPQQSIWLTVKVRLYDLPSRHTHIAIYDDPEVAKWLLLHLLHADKMADELVPSDTVLARLRDIGVIVDEMPVPGVFFPDPQIATDTDRELSIAARIYRQTVGQDIPAPVRRILGKHKPILPPDSDLLWLQDAGTGLVYPTISTTNVAQDQLKKTTEAPAARREAKWKAQRAKAGEWLKSRHYAVLREIFPPAQRDMLRHYVRELVARGYFPPLGHLDIIELRAGIHNQKTIASFHHGLAMLLSEISEEPLIASYCYLACYKAGAVLKRHTDRPQCVYNLSVVFDMDGPEGEPDPWPIYLELDNKPVAIHLRVGDGILYSGTEVPHWRDALPEGQRAIVGFFHFVAEDFRGSLH